MRRYEHVELIAEIERRVAQARDALDEIRVLAADPPGPRRLLDSKLLGRYLAAYNSANEQMRRITQRFSASDDRNLLSLHLMDDGYSRKRVRDYQRDLYAAIEGVELLAAVHPDLLPTDGLRRVKLPEAPPRGAKEPSTVADLFTKNFDAIDPKQHDELIKWCDEASRSAMENVRSRPEISEMQRLLDEVQVFTGSRPHVERDVGDDNMHRAVATYVDAFVKAATAPADIQMGNWESPSDRRARRAHRRLRSWTGARNAGLAGQAPAAAVLPFSPFWSAVATAGSSAVWAAGQMERGKQLRVLRDVDKQQRAEGRAERRAKTVARRLALTLPIDDALRLLKDNGREVDARVYEPAAQVRAAWGVVRADRRLRDRDTHPALARGKAESPNAVVPARVVRAMNLIDERHGLETATGVRNNAARLAEQRRARDSAQRGPDRPQQPPQRQPGKLQRPDRDGPTRGLEPPRPPRA